MEKILLSGNTGLKDPVERIAEGASNVIRRVIGKEVQIVGRIGVENDIDTGIRPRELYHLHASSAGNNVVAPIRQVEASWMVGGGLANG